MCTIGVVFDGDTINTFKQCDLIPVTTFNDPEVRSGVAGSGVTSYIAMTREGSDGIWAGSNDAGVAFIAADSYTTNSAGYYTTGDQVDALFQAYEKSISSYTSAQEAADFLCAFYKDIGDGTPFPAPDIAMITGWADANKTQPIAIFIEYMPNPYNQDSIRTIEVSSGFFASTNHFRLQPDAVNYPANHSTYARLNRAEAILQSDPTLNGITTLLTDQYYGKTELSICRETDYIGAEFHTQGTFVLSIDNTGGYACQYQINGNPKDNPLKPFPIS